MDEKLNNGKMPKIGVRYYVKGDIKHHLPNYRYDIYVQITFKKKSTSFKSRAFNLGLAKDEISDFKNFVPKNEKYLSYMKKEQNIILQSLKEVDKELKDFDFKIFQERFDFYSQSIGLLGYFFVQKIVSENRILSVILNQNDLEPFIKLEKALTPYALSEWITVYDWIFGDGKNHIWSILHLENNSNLESNKTFFLSLLEKLISSKIILM